MIINSSQPIKSWPGSERPRERLSQCGASALSDAELVALLLRSGMRGKDAAALARELLGAYGGLRGLLALSWPELQRVKGLGPAKIAALLATSEIARRQLKEEISGKDAVRDPESVVRYLCGVLRDRKREVFKVLFLDKSNRIITEKDLFEGTIDQAAVHPREIVKSALECHATAVILVHNHPSGREAPSNEDRDITLKIEAACRTVSVKILDHLIVGDNSYFSFCEHGLIGR